MIQDRVSDNRIKENKYKILRMSLLLGADGNREETLNDFEESAREIDAMNDDVYLKDLQVKFYDTKDLKEEEKKLEGLVDYIDGRVEQRISLLTDFSNVTGFDLQDLPPIKYYDKLDDYKERLGFIREYLGNVDRLNTLNRELKDDKKKLEAAYKAKEANEEFNQRSENMLLNKFFSIVKSLDYFKEVNEDNINTYLDEVIAKALESKKSLDIFAKSFSTLLNSGINPQEEEEYRSYVTDAQKVYYDNKEKEYLFKVYQYLINKESEYNNLLVKRDCINDLLYERLNLRQEFGISGSDVLSALYDVLERQYHEIERQGENVKAIDDLNEHIKQITDEINVLELDNQKVEILALLREFGVIDTYSSDKEEVSSDVVEAKEEVVDNSDNSSLFDLPDEVNDKEDSVTDEVETVHNDIFDKVEDVKTEEVENNESKEEDIFSGALDNQIVLVENADNIDLDFVHSKASKVMKRVGEMLGIKPSDEKVVSVTDESASVSNENIFPVEEKKEEVKEEINPLFNNEVSITATEQNDNNIVNNDVAITTTEQTDNSEDNGDFWFPSETPDALEELPDLDVKPDANSDNFFASNAIPDLNFPDLKLDSGNGEA